MIFRMFCFRIYLLLDKFRNKVKLNYYKYQWPGQVSFGKGFLFGKGSTIVIETITSKIVFLDGVKFRNYCNIVCGLDGVLFLGENVSFNNYCSINCLYDIKIGDNTIIGEGVRMYDHNHLFRDKEKLIVEQGFKFGAIKIGSNCWIGSNTIILPNVTIGNNVVIGACNIIHKSIPDNTIVVAESQSIFKDY